MWLQNILEKFNPGAKQLIGSSKSYLKSLHGTSAASKVFIETLAKLAVNAHEGGTTDIGAKKFIYLRLLLMRSEDLREISVVVAQQVSSFG